MARTLLGAVIGVALGSADVWWDPDVGLPPGWRYSADTASGLLTTAIGAMVGLFGFVVTISVLVVQMATGTLALGVCLILLLLYLDRLAHTLRPVRGGDAGRAPELRPIAGSMALGSERSIEDDPAFALRP